MHFTSNSYLANAMQLNTSQQIYCSAFWRYHLKPPETSYEGSSDADSCNKPLAMAHAGSDLSLESNKWSMQ